MSRPAFNYKPIRSRIRSKGIRDDRIAHHRIQIRPIMHINGGNKYIDAGVLPVILIEVK